MDAQQLHNLRYQIMERVAGTNEQFSTLKRQYREQKKIIQRAHLTAMDELRAITAELNKLAEGATPNEQQEASGDKAS